MGVEPIVLVLEWFMCVFTRTLPWESVLRVLDMFFCEGKIVMFRVGLVLLERCFGNSSYRKSCEGLDDVIMRAQEITSKLDNPDELVHEIRVALARSEQLVALPPTPLLVRTSESDFLSDHSTRCPPLRAGFLYIKLSIGLSCWSPPPG
ncbi:unnamed protein product [Dibothriocephalus latus]|uniref:Rab-GAP TBC domain-containing protein n=1 Tax=Dibothriocephalus latus TaxID=60516 RepID=A0A3P7P5Q5_DIBLA|nr:unnamed protein product [Dibothriocephalus latus]